MCRLLETYVIIVFSLLAKNVLFSLVCPISISLTNPISNSKWDLHNYRTAFFARILEKVRPNNPIADLLNFDLIVILYIFTIDLFQRINFLFVAGIFYIFRLSFVGFLNLFKIFICFVYFFFENFFSEQPLYFFELLLQPLHVRHEKFHRQKSCTSCYTHTHTTYTILYITAHV